MKLHDIVCDFDLAKKLRKLGVKRKSIFNYYASYKDEALVGRGVHDVICNTYTVAELREMLPYKIKYMSVDHYFESQKVHDHWFCSMINFDTMTSPHMIEDGKDKKEANSRAKLLIWLIENKHVNVEELNK